MKKFEAWLQEKHPDYLEEGLIDWGKKAIATGVAAGALTLGQGCTGNKCPTSPMQDAPPIQTVQKKSVQQVGQTQMSGSRSISIDDGRMVPIPDGVDPLEYLDQVNQARQQMGQPPLPIEKTRQYWDGLRRR